jgi:trehalose utilization protein
MSAERPIRVTVWGENRVEQSDPDVRAVYPDGMHETIAGAIRCHIDDRVEVRTATLDEPSHGLDGGVLETTDVLTWWGHLFHDDVADGVAATVQQRVLDGMGLVVLHSGHLSKPFKRLMGTSCNLRWREEDDRELVWTVNPAHPIARGVPPVFAIERQEMYGEFFDIPAPDELVFISSFAGGEVFRSGCVFRRGQGRIFYFSPGHEDYPVYHQPEVRRVIANAVNWAAQPGLTPYPTYGKGKSVHSPTGWFAVPPTER